MLKCVYFTFIEECAQDMNRTGSDHKRSDMVADALAPRWASGHHQLAGISLCIRPNNERRLSFAERIHKMIPECVITRHHYIYAAHRATEINKHMHDSLGEPRPIGLFIFNGLVFPQLKRPKLPRSAERRSGRS